ncbi:MAG: hypothetical protein J6M35_03330 [Clostridia bacterium]|nr:hypothetical protein [Clostridia bacterium]
MNQRVIDLAKLSRERDLYEPSVTVEYDPMDMALPEPIFNAKRIIEYILAQPVYIAEQNRYTGMLRFRNDVGVPADIFHRTGHKHFAEAQSSFYRKYIDNLIVFEWQHSAPNYQYIVENGIEGSLKDIAYYKEQYRFDKERYQYLEGVEQVCNGLIAWSEKCARAHEDAAADCNDEARKAELLKLAEICRRVPRKKAETFYEGLQCIIFCFQFLPDSVGTIDRTLWKLYEKDIRDGVITRDEAKDLVGEFFVHLSNHTPAGHVHANRTAECHFAIGGYTEKGEDGFTDLSRLLVEALMELDIRRPAISLRWTKKTPYEVLRFMLDCERNDKNKRFAFVNDEPRIKALMNICGFTYSDAVRYTMCGCNEPSFPGALFMGGLTVNIARSLTNTLYNRTCDIIKCSTFDEFYEIYREELKKDFDIILDYHDKFSDMRSKDINVLSAFLLDGCIENAKSPTQYGCKHKIGGIEAMGITCVIDSLSIIKQFVFDEKRTDMAHLVETMKNDWQSDSDLRTEILKEGRFFGNNDPLSDEMAQRFTTELYNITKDRKFRNGAGILIGTLAGYNPHHMVYGSMTDATPDGRYKGEGFMVGTGQAGGKDRKGLLPLMRSLAQMDPTGILCGPNVCNMMIDGLLMKNDEYFEKVCLMIEEYFRLGGIHVQLNYVTKEELIEARKAPEKYRSLKVRVSGYSDNFVDLGDQHQTEILNRTVKGC